MPGSVASGGTAGSGVAGEGPPDPDWRRDLHFTLRCLCGHLKDEHRHDLTASSPCYRGGCGCQHLRPDARVFYEHRTVTEPIEETS